MAKLAVFFFAALAFQAVFASVPGFYQEGKLVNYLDEIRTEVRDLTLFLEKDFPDSEHAIETVVWQSRRFVEVVEVILSKLRDETFTYREDGHKVFRQVIYVLEQVRDSLKQVSLYHDITKVHELKKNFILAINVVYEHIEKLVQLTYTYYPEFRYTLKYVLVDFITTLQEIRSRFVHINQQYEVVKSPSVLIKDIHQYTREFTEIVKDFSHPSQFKVALREYLLYVTEIVRKLERESILGNKEIDVILHHLTNKLREIVFPVSDIVDFKVFSTKVVSDLLEVVTIFEQLVQLCDDKVLPVEVRTLLLRIIYNYYHAIRHVVSEIKIGHKIGFYKPEYYRTEYYGKHGYGLYESEFHRRFYTPYKYDNRFYGRYNVEDIYNPYKFETLFPVRKYDREYLSGLKHDYQTPKDLAFTIRHLVKRVFETFEPNTFEVSEVKPVLVYRIREFINVLDYIVEKLETKVVLEQSLYTDKMVEEFIYRIKEIKRELREIVSTEVITNVRDVKIHFVRYVDVVATELYKLIEKFESRDYELVLIKDISIRFITFLNKFSYERTYSREHYPSNNWVNTVYNQRYYKDSTIVPYVFSRGYYKY